MKRIATICLGLLAAGCDTLPAQIDSFQDMFSAGPAAEAQREQALARVLQRDAVTGELEFVGETHYVILSDFQFDPDVIRLKSGTVARIRLSNASWIMHYFGAEDFLKKGAEWIDVLGSNVPSGQHHVPVAPFTERDLYLYIKTPGEYPLSCFVPNHYKAGMRGALVVESASLVK